MAMQGSGALPQGLGAVAPGGLMVNATETFITAVPSTHCLKIPAAWPHVSSLSNLPLDSTKKVLM